MNQTIIEKPTKKSANKAITNITILSKIILSMGKLPHQWSPKPSILLLFRAMWARTNMDNKQVEMRINMLAILDMKILNKKEMRAMKRNNGININLPRLLIKNSMSSSIP